MVVVALVVDPNTKVFKRTHMLWHGHTILLLLLLISLLLNDVWFVQLKRLFVTNMPTWSLALSNILQYLYDLSYICKYNLSAYILLSHPRLDV